LETCFFKGSGNIHQADGRQPFAKVPCAVFRGRRGHEQDGVVFGFRIFLFGLGRHGFASGGNGLLFLLMICEFIALAEQGTDVGFAVFRVKAVEATVKMLMTQENANITYPLKVSAMNLY
jgi:hypothetical protein